MKNKFERLFLNCNSYNLIELNIQKYKKEKEKRKVNLATE